MIELEKAKEIFLSDVDEATYNENLELLTQWEKDLIKNQAYEQWKSIETTQELNRMVRDAYKDCAMQLAVNRNLTEAQRLSLYAKQDACLFILSLTDIDAGSALKSLMMDIRRAVDATT